MRVEIAGARKGEIAYREIRASDRCREILKAVRSYHLRLKSELVEAALEIIYRLLKLLSEECMPQCQVQCAVLQCLQDLEDLGKSLRWTKSALVTTHPAISHVSQNGAWTKAISGDGRVDLAAIYNPAQTRSTRTLGPLFRDPDAVQLTRNRRTEPDAVRKVVADFQTGIVQVCKTLREKVGEGYMETTAHDVIQAGRLFQVRPFPSSREAQGYCIAIAKFFLQTALHPRYMSGAASVGTLAKTLYASWVAIWEPSLKYALSKSVVAKQMSECSECDSAADICLRCLAEITTARATELFNVNGMMHSELRAIVQFYGATTVSNIRCESSWDHVRGFLRLTKTVGTRIPILDARLRTHLCSPRELDAATLQTYLLYWALGGAGKVTEDDSPRGYKIKWRNPSVAEIGAQYNSTKRFTTESLSTDDHAPWNSTHFKPQ